jgi:hypothetical protein
MKVKDLKGNISTWKLLGYTIDQQTPAKSTYHGHCRQIIKELYPNIVILEEVPVHVLIGKVLYIDMYLPFYQKCVEIHGEQHYKFIPFFHGTVQNFLRQKQNDKLKEEWCEINGITYIGLPFNRMDEWKNILQTT